MQIRDVLGGFMCVAMYRYAFDSLGVISVFYVAMGVMSVFYVAMGLLSCSGSRSFF